MHWGSLGIDHSLGYKDSLIIGDNYLMLFVLKSTLKLFVKPQAFCLNQSKKLLLNEAFLNFFCEGQFNGSFFLDPFDKIHFFKIH